MFLSNSIENFRMQFIYGLILFQTKMLQHFRIEQKFQNISRTYHYNKGCLWMSVIENYCIVIEYYIDNCSNETWAT